MDESPMNMDTLFKSQQQSTILVKPGDGLFDDPSVNTQIAAVGCSSFGQDWFGSQRPKLTPMRFGIINQIALKFVLVKTGTTDLASDRSDGSDRWNQLRHIVTAGSGDDDSQRNTLGIGQQKVLRSVLPVIYGTRAGLRPPKTARTDELSTRAWEKSIRSAHRRRLSSNRWSFSHIPIRCQFRNCCQQLTSGPQSISLDRYSHGMPVVETYRIPVRHCRFVNGLRPGYRNRFGFGWGKTGSINNYNSSSNSAFMGMSPSYSRTNQTTGTIFLR